MIRFYVVILQVLLTLFSGFLSGDVTVKMDVADQINAGKDIKVQITLNKGDLNGFSRYLLELPAGITATADNSANADFTFKDQKVRLIWLRLPSESTITFSYTIHCDERLKGKFNIAGKFSYINENERKTIDIESHSLAIIPSPNIDSTLLVDINDFGKSLQKPTNEASTIACIRQKPLWSETNKSFTVTLLVNKESLKKFAKIEELIPKGFTALNLNSKEGIFTFKDNKAKFLWMNLPSDEYFTVSYKLIPQVKGPNIEQPAIAGNFSYMDDDKSKSIPIIEKDADLTNLTPEAVKNILQSPVYIAQAGTLDNTKQPEVKTEPVNQNINTVATNETIPKKETKNVAVANASKSLAQELPNQLSPQTGLYFRIQIAAGHKPVNIKQYFKKFKLDNTIYKENHEGWIKYSVGNFTAYKDARDYRVHIWNTSIPDAFVAAYNDNKRITVQEALMISNQKWVK